MTGHRGSGPVGPEVDLLRTLFLFEALPEHQLAWVADHSRLRQWEAGDVIVRQGDPAEVFAVLLAGTVSVTQRDGPEEVEIVRSDQRGAYFGAIRSYVLPDATERYLVTTRAVTDVEVLELPARAFGEAVRSWFPMAVHLLDGLFLALQDTTSLILERQQLLVLGSLAASLTHELNNPAAAASRAGAGIEERVRATHGAVVQLVRAGADADTLDRLAATQADVLSALAASPALGVLDESDREDEVGDWLCRHGVADVWSLAPVLAAAGVDTAHLERVAADAGPALLAGAVRWLADTLDLTSLRAELGESVARIAGVIGRAQEYTHMDRGGRTRFDLATGLRATVTMLSGRLSGIRVVEDLDGGLPLVSGHPGQLNLVWTHLVQNAVDALGSSGTLTIRTRAERDAAIVEVCDTGPGVPPHLLERIFEPTFTTRPAGAATGVGLSLCRHIVGRHHGELTVTSVPGDTRFTVRLPLHHPAEPDDPTSPDGPDPADR